MTAACSERHSKQYQEDYHNELLEFCKAAVAPHTVVHCSALIGSAAINGYDGEQMDYDVLLLVSAFGCPAGFREDGEETYERGQGNFVSLRCDEHPRLNLILCSELYFFELWARSVEVCVYLSKRGLKDKATRVAVHQMIMDGITAEEAIDCQTL